MTALLRQRTPDCLVISISELPPSQPIDVIEVIGAQPQALPAPDHDSTTNSAHYEAAA